MKKAINIVVLLRKAWLAGRFPDQPSRHTPARGFFYGQSNLASGQPELDGRI